MTLDQLGWSALKQKEFAVHAALGLVPGRVVSEHRSHYQVATDVGEVSAGTSGRIRNTAGERSELPGVGDFVAVRLSGGDGPATIDTVLPRSTALVRKASSENRPQLLAANIDVVLIVTAVAGDFNLERIGRYLALVRESGAAPVIVLNKSDLASDLAGPLGELTALAPGVPIHAISARAADSIRDIAQYFDGNRTVVLVGSSGVGKSTLTNQLLGHVVQATQEVRAHDSRGRHTTTHRQLFVRAQGGSLIDTPGLRGLELWNAAVPESKFDDIVVLATQCKFSNCRHANEPGCAVRAAVASGDLDAARAADFANIPRPSAEWAKGSRRRT